MMVLLPAAAATIGGCSVMCRVHGSLVYCCVYTVYTRVFYILLPETRKFDWHDHGGSTVCTSPIRGTHTSLVLCWYVICIKTIGRR